MNSGPKQFNHLSKVGIRGLTNFNFCMTLVLSVETHFVCMESKILVVRVSNHEVILLYLLIDVQTRVCLPNNRLVISVDTRKPVVVQPNNLANVCVLKNRDAQDLPSSRVN